MTNDHRQLTTLMENPFGDEPIELEITDVLDLHGFVPAEVGKVTRIYLAEARKKNFKWVRIIHGRGIGMQRDRVRKILAETDFVESFKDGDELSGGWGAQVIKLK